MGSIINWSKKLIVWKSNQDYSLKYLLIEWHKKIPHSTIRLKISERNEQYLVNEKPELKIKQVQCSNGPSVLRLTSNTSLK